MLVVFKFIIKWIFKILGLIPMKWYLNGLIGYSTTSMSFYSVGLSSYSFIDKYVGLLDKSIIIEFLIYCAIYLTIFYVILDFIFRLLFHKWLKKKVYDFLKGKYNNSKFDHYRDLVDIRSRVTKGINLPFELGYLKRTEIEPLEITSITKIEKEEAINEIFKSLNQSACMLIHGIFAGIFLAQFNWILASITIIALIFLVPFIGAVLVILIENINAIPIIQKSISRSSV